MFLQQSVYTQKSLALAATVPRRACQHAKKSPFVCIVSYSSCVFSKNKHYTLIINSSFVNVFVVAHGPDFLLIIHWKAAIMSVFFFCFFFTYLINTQIIWKANTSTLRKCTKLIQTQSAIIKHYTVMLLETFKISFKIFLIFILIILDPLPLITFTPKVPDSQWFKWIHFLESEQKYGMKCLYL